jgi:hypothetical protein
MPSTWLPQDHDGCPLVNFCTLLGLALGQLSFSGQTSADT